jgi:SAM-dependent methyltransferase
MANIDYVGVDLNDRPNIGTIADLTATPYASDTFDAIICIHVLEEIEQDRKAIGELFRVLKSGGWAFITVPVRLDRETFEDPTIVDPKERERAFGEKAHVRIYGFDLIDRLEAGGFEVQLALGTDIEQESKEKYGLNDDENVFFCTKS